MITLENKHFIKQKKAQVTLFVILAIIIVAAVIFFFVFSGKIQISQQKNPAENYFFHPALMGAIIFSRYSVTAFLRSRG